MRPHRSRLAAVALGALLATLALAAGGPPASAASLTAVFTRVSDWGSGFEGKYTVSNPGPASVSGWRVEFDLPSGASVTSFWDSVMTRSGQHFVFSNASWNASVGVGASVSFGFNGSPGGVSPANCLVNGVSCSGGGGGGDTTAPSVPANLRVTGTSSSSVSLAWDASTDNVGVAGYELSRDGGSPSAVSGTSVTVSGLSASTSYRFRVRARDGAGNVSAYSTEVTATTGGGTPPPPPPPGTIRFAPYVDITRSTPTLASVAQATGVRAFTLAFALGDASGCNPSWGGTIPLTDSRIIGSIRDLQALGGQVVVATGGALGPYLEHVCGTSATLLTAYKRVLDTVGTNHLDVDVEASIDIAKVNTALRQLQVERGTTISYTLRVQGQDFGVDPFSLQILQDAAARGLEVLVNPMLMNFGFTGTWGQAMVDAANATLGQMRGVWPGRSEATLRRMLGITPMIGRNDSGMTTTQTDARTLLSYAQNNHIGLIAFWSVGRDNGGCPGGGVSPSCSGISQSLYEFTNIFKAFTG